MKFIHCAIAAAVFTATVIPARASNVITVGPGQMFTDLPSAFTAAQSGDVLLLRSFGAVADFWGKGISVIEDSLFSVSITPTSPSLPIFVQNVPAGSVFTLSGAETTYLVQVANCDGPVRFQNCDFNAGLTITNCADVRLSNCKVRGRPPTFGFGSGSTALAIDGSDVVLDHTLISGSNGGNAGFLSGFPVGAGAGGDGMHVTNSTALASGCTLQSGGGGGGMSGSCGGPTFPSPGGAAGDALVVTDAVSSVALLETTPITLQPGFGGFGFPSGLCSQPAGAAGMPVDAPLGTVTFLPGSARWITTLALAREAQVLHLDAFGQTGDTVVLALSDGCSNGVTVFPQGSIGIALPPRRIVVGTIGALGTLAINLNVPELGTGVLGRVYYAQVVCIDTTGQSWFGTPMALTLLDSSL